MHISDALVTRSPSGGGVIGRGGTSGNTGTLREIKGEEFFVKVGTMVAVPKDDSDGSDGVGVVGVMAISSLASGQTAC